MMDDASPQRDPAGISIAIPTFGREQVLIESIRAVLALRPAPAELLVLDQTPQHETATRDALAAWDRSGAIRWIQLEQPSITGSMNLGLSMASQPIVLFLDDDIIPDPGLIAGHRSAYGAPDVWAVVGQVLQPQEQVIRAPVQRERGPLRRDLLFPFNSDLPCFVHNCIGCNLSVRRDRILSIGGFDENFVDVAYRYETEFARRVWQRGGQVLFEPAASIRHLRASRGGTRSYGNHLQSMRPAHSVGDYYFALSQGLSADSAIYCLHRLARSTTTRYHLSHPWWIVPKLLGELWGLLYAVRLAMAGPKLLHSAGTGPATDHVMSSQEMRELCSREPST